MITCFASKKVILCPILLQYYLSL